MLAQGAMVILVDARWFWCVLAKRVWAAQALGELRVARMLSLSSACRYCVMCSLLDAALLFPYPPSLPCHWCHSLCWLCPRLARLRLRRRFRACVFAVMYCLHWCVPPPYVTNREDPEKVRRPSSRVSSRRASSVAGLLSDVEAAQRVIDGLGALPASSSGDGVWGRRRRDIVSVQSDSIAAWKIIQCLSQVGRVRVATMHDLVFPCACARMLVLGGICPRALLPRRHTEVDASTMIVVRHCHLCDVLQGDRVTIGETSATSESVVLQVVREAPKRPGTVYPEAPGLPPRTASAPVSPRHMKGPAAFHLEGSRPLVSGAGLGCTHRTADLVAYM